MIVGHALRVFPALTFLRETKDFMVVHKRLMQSILVKFSLFNSPLFYRQFKYLKPHGSVCSLLT